MRGLRSTIVIIVLLAGFGAYAYFVTSKKPAPGTTPPKDRVFTGVEANAISKFTVKGSSGQTTTLDKSKGSWRLVAPLQTGADDDDVTQITSNLSTLEIDRVVDENPTDLNPYGLKTPRIEVDFTAGKDSHRLYLGDKSPTGGDLFARRDDDKKVYLIPGYTESIFDRTTFDLRDKSIVNIEPDKVTAIEFSSGGKTMRLNKAGDTWAIVTPVSLPGDDDNINMFLNRIKTAAMKSLTVEQATPEDLKRDGFDTPQGTLTLDSGSSRVSLVVGGKAEDKSDYVRDVTKPWIATVDASFLGELQKGVNDYRRRALFEFKGFDADHLQFTRGGQAIAFERVKSADTPDKWRRVNPNPGQPDQSKMESLIAKVENLRALDFVDSTAKTGLDKPTLTVDVNFQDGKKQEHVTFAKNGDDVFAAIMGQPGAAKVATSEFDDAVKALDEVSK
jgi:hypothetical protein